MFFFCLREYHGPMSFHMERAQITDVENVVNLVESVYRGESSQQGWTTEADLLEGQRVDNKMVREMIERPDTALLVYKDHGSLQGAVYLEKQQETVLLGLLSVDVRRQGKRLGQSILAYCEPFILKTWSVQTVKIHVLWQRAELIAWYERRGFRKTGKTKPFPSDPKFGLPKVKDLHFVEMEKTISL